jgi:hypothetical protein
LPAKTVQSFRVLPAALGMSVRDLLGKAINMTFERNGVPSRIAIATGRWKRD